MVEERACWWIRFRKNGFMLRVNELLEKHILDLQQKLTLDKEFERKVKMLEREEQKMHKVMRAHEKKMVTVGNRKYRHCFTSVKVQSQSLHAIKTVNTSTRGH